MPRQPRQISQGEYYHILSRGNNRQTLFLEDADLSFYLQALLRYTRKYEVSVFHYCLMQNHTHFLMAAKVFDEGITQLMRALQTSYAVYFKKKYATSGHVFENRFRDFHIENESYLMECGRYIERNPVRAGIVKRPADYRWSSYRPYAMGIEDLLLTFDPCYLALGLTEKERQSQYREYVETPRAYETIIDRYFEERVLV